MRVRVVGMDMMEKEGESGDNLMMDNESTDWMCFSWQNLRPFLTVRLILSIRALGNNPFHPSYSELVVMFLCVKPTQERLQVATGKVNQLSPST